MSTTTIRLPDELKSRIEKLTAATGSTVHAFMLEAVAEVTERAERRREFEAEAHRRLQHMAETGEYFTTDDLRASFQALAHQEAPTRPAPRRMGQEELERFRASLGRAD